MANDIKRRRHMQKRDLERRLGELLKGDRNDENMAEIIDTRLQLNSDIDKDEVYWEQRARANWLRLGDKNTSFFHRLASMRKKKRNSIVELKCDDGRTICSDDEIGEEASNFFQNLFTSNTFGDSTYIVSGIHSIITNEDNESILAQFTEEEIFATLKSMAPTKASGFDGYLAIFFQKVWKTVRSDVVQFCLDALNTGNSISSANVIEIVLISKTQNPNLLVNFRSISLCSVLYKLMANVLANRLQHLIGKCVYIAQSAFVPGRLITDNVLLGYELLDTFRKKNNSRRKDR